MFNIQNMLLAVTVICGMSIGMPLQRGFLLGKPRCSVGKESEGCSVRKESKFRCGDSELQQRVPAYHVTNTEGKPELCYPRVSDEDKKHLQEIEEKNEFATANNPEKQCLEETMKFINMLSALSDEKKKDINFWEEKGEARNNRYLHTIDVTMRCGLAYKTFKRLLRDGILPTKYETMSQFENDPHPIRFVITYYAGFYRDFYSNITYESYIYEPESIQIYYKTPDYETFKETLRQATPEEELAKSKEYWYQRKIYYVNIRICGYDSRSCKNGIPIDVLRAVSKAFAKGNEPCIASLSAKDVYAMIYCPLLHI